ncbi:MAG: DUF1697 domain-containing protein [Bacteroidia bacterium]|nr:DUF1697 domain-containing protein [Bacteroidia bacterium]
MKTFIALLRGINVSGQKKVRMAELRDLLSTVGLEDVRTYIQSGNVIFSSELSSEKDLALKIKKAIHDNFGFEVPVLVIEPKIIQKMIDRCPFPTGKKENSYFTLLFDLPDPQVVEGIKNINFEGEELSIEGRFVYFYSSMGYGRSKLNNNFLERKLKIKATARNYRTMMKLLSLCNHNQPND